MTDQPQSPAAGQPYPPGVGPVYAGQPAPAPGTPRKPWFKKWWVWVLALIVLGGVGNALGNRPTGPQATTTTAAAPGTGGTASETKPEETTTSAPAPVEKPRLTLNDGWKMDKSDGYFVYVTGYVSNNTDEAITTYVQITFDALDKAGANLGTCLANTNTIDAKGKWKFKAMCSGEAKEIASVRFKEITGF